MRCPTSSQTAFPSKLVRRAWLFIVIRLRIPSRLFFHRSPSQDPHKPAPKFESSLLAILREFDNNLRFTRGPAPGTPSPPITPGGGALSFASVTAAKHEG